MATRLILLVFVQLLSVASIACPLCHSSTAEEVRAGLVSTSLDGITVPALLLPLVLVALAVCAIQIEWDELLKFRSNSRNVK